MEKETIDYRLSDFLNNGNDWERKQTSIPGVFYSNYLPSKVGLLVLQLK
jgi:hypothetical protein